MSSPPPTKQDGCHRNLRDDEERLGVETPALQGIQPAVERMAQRRQGAEQEA